MSITASSSDIRDTIARIVLDTIASRADPEIYGVSYAKVFNKRRADRAADAILDLLQPSIPVGWGGHLPGKVEP